MNKRLEFIELLKNKWQEDKLICIGLDSDFAKLPASIKTKSIEDSIFNFNKEVIDKTCDLVCSYKINTAFYEAQGLEGWKALEKTVQYINSSYPDIPVILDAKRGDIGNTNSGYVKMAFDILGVDGITINPYLGKDALQPFLERADKGIFILVKTSNPGAGEFQDLEVYGKLFYQVVAEHVASQWNENGNCGVVVGATYPDELKIIREIVGDLPILVPGIGAQGGNLEKTVKAGKNSKNQGIIVSASRGIIYAENPRAAAEKLHQEIVRIIR